MRVFRIPNRSKGRGDFIVRGRASRLDRAEATSYLVAEMLDGVIPISGILTNTECRSSGRESSTSMERHRVAITGIGVLSPAGADAEESFAAIAEGRGKTRTLPDALASFTELAVGGLIDAFDPARIVGKKNVKRTARFVQLALAAAQQACIDAQLKAAGYEPDRVGAIVGSALGGLDMARAAVHEFRLGGPRRVSAYALAAAISNMASGLIAIEQSARGPCYGTSAGWATSGHAIARALDLVRRGEADAVLAGGTDAIADPFALAILGRTGDFSLSRERGATTPRPFDVSRDGAVPSEGAAILVIERLDSAVRRGARIYAELAGCGSSYTLPQDQFDGTRDRSIAAAISAALVDAQVGPEDVDYVNAYGSGGIEGDRSEALAIQRVLEQHAERVCVSGIKGVTGHMLGAASAFEAAMTSFALSRGIVPPIANLEVRDPECHLDFVRTKARVRKSRVAIANTFSETGHNLVLVLKAV